MSSYAADGTPTFLLLVGVSAPRCPRLFLAMRSSYRTWRLFLRMHSRTFFGVLKSFSHSRLRDLLASIALCWAVAAFFVL